MKRIFTTGWEKKWLERERERERRNATTLGKVGKCGERQRVPFAEIRAIATGMLNLEQRVCKRGEER